MSGGGSWLRLIPYVLKKILIGCGSSLESFLRTRAFVPYKWAGLFPHCFSVNSSGSCFFFWDSSLLQGPAGNFFPLCLIQQLLPRLWSVESAGKAFAFVTSELQLCNSGLTSKDTRQFLCCTLQQTWSARPAPTPLWKQRSWPQAWRAEEKPRVTLWRCTQAPCPTGFQMWHKN